MGVDMDDRNELGSSDADSHAEAQAAQGVQPTRRMLMMGAIAASAVVSVRPALAQTTGSILNCEIPVPGPHGAGQYIDAYGNLVPADTPGAFPAAGRPFTGEEVKRAMAGRSLPGTSYEQNEAYVNYIRKLQAGQSGFTCYASIQMPR